MGRRSRRPRASAWALVATAGLAGATAAVACRGGEHPRPEASPPAALLRVGSAQLSTTSNFSGLQQLSNLLTVEGLARPGDDGRMVPVLAESWSLGPDGGTINVKLRPHVTFHDGSPVDSNAVAALLPAGLQSTMGPVYGDIDHVSATGVDMVEIGLKHPSPFLAEALEAIVQKRESKAGTGPFVVDAASTTDMRANVDYYLGPPSIDRIRVENYTSVRAAWADLLRDRIDMLWEVGPDALESMTGATTISTFTFTRRYQHLIALNPAMPAMRSAAIRRALNLAIDRPALIRSALSSYGIPSGGAVWPRYWALPSTPSTFEYAPEEAAKAIRQHAAGGTLRITCLIPPDTVNERIALEVKRQLQAVGVEMTLEALSQEDLTARAKDRRYDAALIEFISGPTLLRPYLIWHSNTPNNWGGFGNATIDRAFDAVRAAPAEGEYRTAVAALQQAFADDPPAIFLAWSVRARAISKRFAGPAEPNRDIVAALRQWKPAAGENTATRR